MVKKLISSFVSFATILWSVGAGALVFPMTAQAATLNAGDLIKASGPAVYVYAENGKRYVFPNEDTFFSWFVDFSSVKTITDAELAAIMIGGNVTIRPGTKLVKITTDPKVYAVSMDGTLHWVETEAIAKALYGDAWATRVVDVSDAFFVNYTVGASISSNVHPNGQLITYAGDSNVYVVWDGMKRKIADDAAFAANHWNMANAVMTTLSYSDGANVTALEADHFWRVAGGAGSGGGTTPVSGSVSIALASDTPMGATLPSNSMGVPLLKVNVTAGSADAMVSGLHFQRVGVGATSDWANVYLYDGMGNRLTTGRSVNSTTNKVEFNALSVSIPANTSKSFYIYGDLSNPGTTGGVHAFQVMDASSVILAGAGSVSGSFPVRGNTFTVGTAAAGTLTIQPGSTPANPVSGQQQAKVSSFKLTAATNDLYVNRISLYQGGDINDSDLKNLKLYQGSTLVASAVGVNSNDQIVFNFTTPYLLADGVTRVFDVYADVAGRAGRTIITYVEYAADIHATDSVYNAGAAVNIAAIDTVGEGITVTTQGGNLTFAFNGPAASNVAKGKLGVELYRFSLTSADNNLEIRNLRVNLAGVGGAKLVGSVSATKYFRNIKIKDLDTGLTVMGPKELTVGTATTNETFVFNQTFNLSAGQTKNLAIVADLSNTEDAAGEFFGNNNKQYQVTWNAFQLGDVKVVDTGESLALGKIVPNANTTGNPMTVKSSGLDAKLASTPVSGSLVKKATNKPVLGIALEAGAQAAIKVTNMNLQCNASINGAAYAANQCATRITALSLWDGDTQVGSSEAPDTTTGQVSITNMNLNIPAGTTKVLEVRATFSSAASAAAPYDKISVGLPTSTNPITAEDDEANSVTATIAVALGTTQLSAAPSVSQTVLDKGVLTVNQESHPNSNIVVAGKDVWVPFARYKATAQYESMKIDRIRVESLTGDNANFQQVAIASGGAVKGAATLPSGATGAVDVDLTGNHLTVPKDGSMTFEIWAKLSSIQASSSVSGATTGVTRSGMQPSLGIDEAVQTGEWNASYAGMLNLSVLGDASGSNVYTAQGATDGNAMVLRSSKPVVTKQALSNSVLSSGDLELYRVQVGADSNGSIGLKQMAFNVSKSANVTAGSFRLYRGSTLVPTGDYTIVNATSGADLKSTDVPAGVNQVYAVVAFTNEDTISGSGNTYSLRATVSYTGTGNNITTSFYRDPLNTVVTGLPKNSTAFGGWASNAGIWSIGNFAGTAVATGTFMWSDLSEVPHSAANNGSLDWTNDVNVEDLAQSATLSN